MNRNFYNQIWNSPLMFMLKWLGIASLVGMLTGSASALFLAGLTWATNSQMNHPWLLYLLPLAGALIAYVYIHFGGNAGRGNNLLLDNIHNGQLEDRIPLRMVPLVLGGTIMTHLFGGSAGREGTALQMGGSLAAFIGRVLRLNTADVKIILMCGIASGFASVFGTPLAGTVFALEIIVIGVIRFHALIPCLMASVIGDRVTTAWGIHHIHYEIGAVPELTLTLLSKVVLAAIAFGLASLLFTKSIVWVKLLYTKVTKYGVLRSFIGGLVIIALVLLFQTRDYLGLSLPLINEAFAGDVNFFAFLWKIAFTALTLGAGFIGGEVTPLFVIGSTLGSSMASLLGEPSALFAALGFVAVFSGAANAPLACFIMGIELFGSDAALLLFVATVISYLFSGKTGIYSSQRRDIEKT